MKQLSNFLGSMVLRSNRHHLISQRNVSLIKRYLFILSVVLCAFNSQSALAQQNTTSLPYVGTWQLVSGTYTNASDTTKYDSTTIAEYKVITPNFFMYSVFKKDADTLLISTTGTVSFRGNQMTHTAQYSTSKSRVGVTATYTVDVRKNKLYQKGKLGDTELEEVWVRLH
jgi:hypothetical protein